MLASTVQFSTYDQSLPNHPRRPTPSAERWRYENREALTEKKRLPALSGPNSVPTTPYSARSVFHTPPR